ncbi:MAG: hypothetical protein RMI94_05815 [Bryobacterales bacterium]|nr:hypothetical protein [Bryobacteraceae bacterium]MDW8130046.1 hypothetical protein [Bryobacterales bacterium]
MSTEPPSAKELVSRLEQASRRMLEPTPEAIEQVARELESVESCLRQRLGAAGDALPGLGGAELRLLRELRRQTRRAAVLLENAAALRLGWARLLSVMTAGYTPQGEPAPLETPASLIVEG